MSTTLDVRDVRLRAAEVVYPEDDGEPLSDNTLQFQWIVTIVGGIDARFRDDPNVFVAGNLLWYPVEGNNKVRAAPDAMVAFGRPKGYRSSYLQWQEGGIAPQVVFEVLSPGNRAAEPIRKFHFYERHGVEEYYLYDPDRCDLSGWLRSGGTMQEIEPIDGWVSPRLGTRFELQSGELKILGPDGRPFATYVELVKQREQEARDRERAVMERDQATVARDQATAERDQATAERDRLAGESAAERERSERLAARLRTLGIDPEA